MPPVESPIPEHHRWPYALWRRPHGDGDRRLTTSLTGPILRAFRHGRDSRHGAPQAENGKAPQKGSLPHSKGVSLPCQRPSPSPGRNPFPGGRPLAAQLHQPTFSGGEK